MRKTNKDEIIVEVTEAEYQADLARGLQEDEVLRPGRHRFVRGGFLKRHGVTPEEVKQWPVTVEVQTRLDLDVFNFLTAQANGRKLGEIINELLRQEMTRQTEALPPAALELLENPQFIKALAIRLASADTKPKRTRKAA
jgi:hypothetical protein